MSALLLLLLLLARPGMSAVNLARKSALVSTRGEQKTAPSWVLKPVRMGTCRKAPVRKRMMGRSVIMAPLLLLDSMTGWNGQRMGSW